MDSETELDKTEHYDEKPGFSQSPIKHQQSKQSGSDLDAFAQHQAMMGQPQVTNFINL